MELVLCHVCGEEATQYFGNKNSLPLCENIVCAQVTIDGLNLLLNEESNVENNSEEAI